MTLCNSRSGVDSCHSQRCANHRGLADPGEQTTGRAWSPSSATSWRHCALTEEAYAPELATVVHD